MRWTVIVLLALIGCGSDSTGPSDTSIAGTWTASLTNLSGNGVSCNSTAATTISLSQQGNSFTGSYSGGEMTCTGPGGTFANSIGNGTVLNGTLNGNSVVMDLDTPDFHLTGTVNGNSMSGTARMVVDIGSSQTITLNGNWGAAH
jgi:hypothetical protein